MNRSASILLGSYQVRQRLGEGGSGQVYRADGPDGEVAVKVLAPAADLDPAARARFAREVATLAAIRHPALVALLDHGIDDELGPYLVLPLLPGTTLRALCAGLALPPEAAVLLAAPIAQATAALHAAGVTHRDLKPDNVMAGPDGRITVIDLGLAWHDGATRLTETGTAVGSVGYMAPEQVEGGTVGPAVDVWAIGVMLYEWIAGRRPFARDRAGEEAAATLVGVFPALTTVDRRVDDVLAGWIARCLATDPAARPTAAALAEALAAWQASTGSAEADPDAARAALVEDPRGYQARLAPGRSRAAAQAARAALAGGDPFGALAACDRGLAYAAADTELAALVREAERAAAARTASVPAIPPAPTAPAAAAAVMVSTTARPTPGAHGWRWRRLAAGSAVVLAALIAIGVVARDRRAAHSQAPGGPSSSTTTTTMTGSPSDTALARDVVGLLGQFVDSSERHEAGTASASDDRALVRGFLSTFGKVVDASEQQRGDLGAQCKRQLSAKSPDALATCDRAVAAAPDDVELRGLRAAARLRGADYAGAVDDLDRLIATADRALWHLGRGKAYLGLGRAADAQADFRRGCAMGDAQACALVAAPAAP
ncbi:MAG: serine/threonine-protein kinase [Kofleriaceae bacterium]